MHRTSRLLLLLSLGVIFGCGANCVQCHNCVDSVVCTFIFLWLKKVMNIAHLWWARLLIYTSSCVIIEKKKKKRPKIITVEPIGPTVIGL